MMVSGELPPNSWLAIRFNLTADHDLTAFGWIRMHPVNESRFGGMTFSIRDGVVHPGDSMPSGLGTLGPNEIAHVSTPLGRTNVSLHGGESESARTLGLGHGGFYHPNESLTRLAIVRSSYTTYYFDAKWTRGVLSWDVQSGPAIVEHFDEWGSGVHAGTYSIAASASAGALLARDLHTQRDTVGWFLPDSAAYWQESVWACSHDDTPCEPYNAAFGSYKVVSKGPTDWRFRVPATMEFGGPSIPLGVAHLPDDGYLAG